MYVVFTVLLILVSLFILAIVLVQNPKGGGSLGTAFGSAASNIIGVQRAGDTLERLTWGAAILLLVLSLGSAFFLPKKNIDTQSKIEMGIQSTTPATPQENTIPLTTPAPAPAEQAPAE
ncbi:MAG: preprotein translocase subunit SecG [Chitinophagales bacterium]|nr:preprotein translocase subunit SecG [Chitinophagales bacterium]